MLGHSFLSRNIPLRFIYSLARTRADFGILEARAPGRNSGKLLAALATSATQIRYAPYGHEMKRNTTAWQGMRLFQMTPDEQTQIVDGFAQTCGLYLIPEPVWRKDLIHLPSPIQSLDVRTCCSSGTIVDYSIPIFQTPIFDVIRQESSPAQGEPEFNVYRHYIVQDTAGSLFISQFIKPDHHWSTAEDLERIYGISDFQ